jgi:hypothetical protein
MIKMHKITGQKLLLKMNSSLVSVLFVLDENECKIKDGRKCNGEPSFKMAICLNKNIC